MNRLDEALNKLGQSHRGARYPGDLVDDLAGRINPAPRRVPCTAYPWRLAVAASLVIAGLTWYLQPPMTMPVPDGPPDPAVAHAESPAAAAAAAAQSASANQVPTTVATTTFDVPSMKPVDLDKGPPSLNKLKMKKAAPSLGRFTPGKRSVSGLRLSPPSSAKENT